jgi:hypothetical protein
MMSTNEKMTIDEVCKYLRKLRPVYEQSNQAQKSQMLDTMELVTGRHRKSRSDYFMDHWDGTSGRTNVAAFTRRTSMTRCASSTRAMAASVPNVCTPTWRLNSPLTTN